MNRLIQPQNFCLGFKHPRLPSTPSLPWIVKIQQVAIVVLALILITYRFFCWLRPSPSPVIIENPPPVAPSSGSNEKKWMVQTRNGLGKLIQSTTGVNPYLAHNATKDAIRAVGQMRRKPKVALTLLVHSVGTGIVASTNWMIRQVPGLSTLNRINTF